MSETKERLERLFKTSHAGGFKVIFSFDEKFKELEFWLKHESEFSEARL